MIKDELQAGRRKLQRQPGRIVPQPTSASERFEILDVLRGFALLGVLLANMSTHSGYFFLSPAKQEALSTAQYDGAVMWVLHFLVEGKFYSLFSLLFGIGFALQMKRGHNLQSDFSGRFRRRLLFLFFMGLLHAVLFYVGDILTVYALTGLFLLLFKKASDKILLRGTIILLVLPIIQYGIILAVTLSGTPAPPPSGPPPIFEQIVATYQEGSYADIVRTNIGGLIFGRYPDLFFTGRFFRVLAMFLLGYYVARKMIFANLEENRPLLRRMMMWSALVGVPLNIALAMMMERGDYYSLQPMGIIQPLVYSFGVPALCLFYASGISLLYARSEGKSWLRIFAPVGKMALTNYLMQSVICCLIFMNYGLGQFGRMGPSKLMLIAIALYTGQVFFSHWWLGRFRFGPMEWLWRSGTYGKWQGMRK